MKMYFSSCMRENKAERTNIVLFTRQIANVAPYIPSSPSTPLSPYPPRSVPFFVIPPPFPLPPSPHPFLLLFPVSPFLSLPFPSTLCLSEDSAKGSEGVPIPTKQESFEREARILRKKSPTTGENPTRGRLEVYERRVLKECET